MKSNNRNKVTCERKTSSLKVIQVQVYRPRVMEPHIDEGSLILWSSSPTLMNTTKKSKKKQKNKNKTKNKKQNKNMDLHVNRPCKNPILKKKNFKTLGFKI